MPRQAASVPGSQAARRVGSGGDERKSMTLDAERLPAWVTWQRRPFPDANPLPVQGRQPAPVDSGFVGHAEETAAWVRAHTGHVALVVNTHWHSARRASCRPCR
jgi:hypothetical protein